jgi:uncharacterized membrane protein
MPDDKNSRTQLLPLVTFVLLVAALVAGVWVFPRIYAYMAEQDCIASGRTNCVRAPADPAQ